MKGKYRQIQNIKEAMDNLPSGVCCFHPDGTIVLCNCQMYRLVFSFTGKDLQCMAELEHMIAGEFPYGKKDRDIFVETNGSAWRFSKESIIISDGDEYIQMIASNVTDLYRSQEECRENNRRLKEQGERLRTLLSNIASMIREEEILNMKMRVHDDMGRSMIATRRLLQEHRPTSEMDLTTWKNALRFLNHESEEVREVQALEQLMKAAEGIGISIRLTGELPEGKKESYLMVIAMRECATNAVRHAHANLLYVTGKVGNGKASVTIRNNGKPPQKEICEGGGLGSLRTKVEKAGGKMTVKSDKEFELTVVLPLELC